MNLSSQLRRWHTWIGLVIGLQVLVWMVSGLYMVAVDIDFIHGDTLVRDERPPLSVQGVLPIGVLLDRYQGLYSAKLKTLPGFEHPIYVLGTPDGPLTVDAVTGAVLSPLSQPTIEDLARRYYAGSGRIAKAELLETVPVEIRGRPPYLWRVDFDDWLSTSFYLDPDTGALIARRHRLWRIFDTFWMLHVMDYGYERDDVNNTLLRVAAAIGVAFGITGVWLLLYSFGRTRRARNSAT
jgi:hypothetical protein